MQDFRSILSHDLQDPEFRRNFLIAYYEEDGLDGLRAALDEIARADATFAPDAPSQSDNAGFGTLRATLNTLGLDFRLVSLQPREADDTTPAARR